MVQVQGTADPAPITQTVTVDPAPMSVAVEVDPLNLINVLLLVGFTPAQTDLAQAIAQAESGMYADAVGDLTVVDAKWGPSIGLFQVRALRHPGSFGGSDLYRHAFPLRDPFYNAKAAFEITAKGTDFSKWSTYISGSYKQYLGQNPTIKFGHAQAANWWK